MDQLLWNRIGELFAEVRERTGAERIAFLKERCGDDHELFEQVMSLLEADSKSGPLDSKPTISGFPVPQIIAGRFRVVRYIAEGGMGTVYEAEDLTLGDRVALKTIRPDIVSHPHAVERFKREISLGKKVTHPNVCRIHDLGAARSEDGAEFLFLTMQFLSGETLASRIKRGPVPTSDALPLIEDMTAALSAAHQADVIHRDFKSGNIMLVQRADRLCAIVTDFGLARQLHDDVSLSKTGMVGTVSYMAPEQIRGEELTPATDIYALGVVMYEMVTGELPFKGDSHVTVAMKQLNEEPRPPRDLAPDLDAGWNAVILGCLRKLPTERFQAATEVGAALAENGSRYRSVVRRGGPNRITSFSLIALSVALSIAMLIFAAVPSVRLKIEEWLRVRAVPHAGQMAVLPIVVPTDDPQSAALEYGLADTLTARLTQVIGNRPLQVVPASEIRAKGITSLDQARQEFGVNLGLELSLHRSGEMVRVNYGLIDATTHHEIRGDTITAPISDGFAIEDRVADSVVKALDLNLEPREKQLLAAHGTNEPDAYDDYLRGRGYLQEFQKPENVESAIALFRGALEKDPQYALAYSGLGEAYWHKYDLLHNKQWAEQAQAACEQSVGLDSNSASGHACLGLVYEGTGKYEEAVKEYQLATAREPTNDTAIRGLASAYQRLGRMRDAEATYQAAIRVRPNYWEGYNALGVFYFTQGQYSQAAEMFTHVTNLASDSYRGYSNLGAAYLQVGRNADAVRALKRSIEIRPSYEGFSNLATAYFRLRQYNDAAHNYSQALSLNDRDYLVWGNLATAYYYSVDNRSKAQSAYEKAVSGAKSALVVNPRDASVHADLAEYYSMLGDREEALSQLAEALNMSSQPNPGLLFRAAMVHNQLGDTELALGFLSKAVKDGYSITNINEAPALDNLRSKKELQAILEENKDTHGQR